MNIFRYISLFLVALLILFFSLGLFKKEVGYVNEITVNADRQEVFDAFSDTVMMKKWLPGFVSFEKVKGNEKDSGSVWRLKLEQDGEVYEMAETFTEFNEGNKVSYILENDVLTNSVEVQFIDVPGGTKVISGNTIKGNNSMWQSIFILLKSGFHKHGQEALENLKNTVEKNKN